MENAEIVLIPMPEMGHLIANVEFTRQLVAQDPRIFIAILIPKLPEPDDKVDAYIEALAVEPHQRIDLVELPALENVDPTDFSSKINLQVVEDIIDLYRPIIKRVLQQRHRRTAAFVFDTFCTPIIDLAKEMEVPSYLFFTSGANMLSMMFQVEALGVDVPSAFGAMPPESTPVKIPGFRNPVPFKVWPAIFLHKEISPFFVSYATKYRKTDGILVNSFMELERDIYLSMSEDEHVPRLYPVGPILNQGRSKNGGDSSRDPVVCWLDDQPVGSVVFLCFGSKGSFEKDQVEQIAVGIERSGHRFLWSLRRPPSGGGGEVAKLPTDYDDLSEVLPEGFLERTAGVGKVIGWAPQAEVLAHRAVGAFVSHCGWNSTLESLWFGVPVVTWPLYAEQQLNAFFLVKEAGLAVELRMDYMCDVTGRKGNMLVTAAEVEAAIRRMMDGEEGAAARKRTKEMSKTARKALEVGGSSSKSFALFIEDVIKNMSST